MKTRSNWCHLNNSNGRTLDVRLQAKVGHNRQLVGKVECGQVALVPLPVLVDPFGFEGTDRVADSPWVSSPSNS